MITGAVVGRVGWQVVGGGRGGRQERWAVKEPSLSTGTADAGEMAAIDAWHMLLRGISSGFLIAAMVWMLPSADSAKLPVITIMTWLIAVGSFTHVVAGSMEAWMLVLAGDWSVWQMLAQFFVPVLIGNMVGGTALFALISYAQVMEEI